MLKLFHILHLLVQICFGSKVGKKGRFTHLAETHAGDKFLVHMSKEKKKLPRHNLEKIDLKMNKQLDHDHDDHDDSYHDDNDHDGSEPDNFDHEDSDGHDDPD